MNNFKQSAKLSLRGLGRVALIASASTTLAACVASNNSSSAANTSSDTATSSAMQTSSEQSSSVTASVISSSQSSASIAVSSSMPSSTVSTSSVAGAFETLRIQAQNYDRTNFNESTPSVREGTPTGLCAEGDSQLMDLENTNDQNGICAIAYTEIGEYVQFAIDIPAGHYDITLRTASDTGSNAAQVIALNGSDLGSLTATAQGWDSYGSATLRGVNIAAGPNTLSITFANAASNLNYLEISEANTQASSSSDTSSIASSSAASSTGGNGIGTVIDDSDYNPSKSKGVMRYGNPEFYLGGFEAGNYACFDNINLTGVKSLALRYGRLHDSIGRVAVYLGSAAITEDPAAINPEQGINIGEFETTSTGAYENFDNVTFRLNNPVEGEQTVCFRAVFGGGVMNLDHFTLSDVDTGQNLTPTNYTFTPPTAPNAVPAISVADGQVLFGGEAKSIAGVSLFWSNFGWGGSGFYTKEAVKSLKDNWNAKLIRVAFGTDDYGSYFDDFWSHRLKLFEVVNAAIENDMYVIIDWHAHTIKSDPTNPARNPTAFFKEMAEKYGAYNNVIYEVFNEPLDESWSGSIKPYAEGVINTIRTIDPDNLIIVGTRNWSQRVDEAANDPINGTNIAYTLHFYADTHRDDIRSFARTAIEKKAALFVTEWGTVAAAGTGNANARETLLWMDFLHDNNISHANWALVDNLTKERTNPASDKHGSSILNLGSDFYGNWSTGDLTESGNLVMDILENWDNWDNWNKAPYQ